MFSLAALIIAYVMAGLGLHSVNKTKPADDQQALWTSPIKCILLWPVTLVKSPWRGAFWGSLLNGIIVYAIAAFLLSLS